MTMKMNSASGGLLRHTTLSDSICVNSCYPALIFCLCEKFMIMILSVSMKEAADVLAVVTKTKTDKKIKVMVQEAKDTKQNKNIEQNNVTLKKSKLDATLVKSLGGIKSRMSFEYRQREVLKDAFASLEICNEDWLSFMTHRPHNLHIPLLSYSLAEVFMSVLTSYIVGICSRHAPIPSGVASNYISYGEEVIEGEVANNSESLSSWISLTLRFVKPG